MYFRNYRLSKTRLVNSLKSAVPEHPSTVNMLKVPNTCEIFMIPLSSYFSITLGRNNLESISPIEV